MCGGNGISGGPFLEELISTNGANGSVRRTLLPPGARTMWVKHSLEEAEMALTRAKEAAAERLDLTI